MPKFPPPTSRLHLGNPGLRTPGIKVLVNECITEIFLIRIYIYIYKHIFIFSQIVHHNPCFSLFMLHNNQESEVKNIFTFQHTVLFYIPYKIFKKMFEQEVVEF